MTAESAHDSYHNQDRQSEQDEVLVIGQGVLIPMHERALERRRAAKQQEMFASFVDYTQENFGIDPRAEDPIQSETIALSAHSFLSGVVQRRIVTLGKLAEQNGEPMPRVHIIPPAPVERNIRAHYKEFGYNRRTKSEMLRTKEEARLAENKRPIYAIIREGGDLDEDGSETPLVKVPRASYFQELALGIELEKVLRTQRYEVAADSVETLLAAYGAWFPQRISEALDNRRAVIRTPGRDSHNIYRIDTSDIPEDFQAERPRYPNNT